MKGNDVSTLAKHECCGCTACYSACPTSAISMLPDDEGFLYPQIDRETCIECGKCLKVCKDVRYHDTAQTIYAIRSNNDDLRARSSSGGVFSLLSEDILADGGLVCAVGYSENHDECLHKIIDTCDALDDLRRAKFVQSKKNDVYKEIKHHLDQGRKMLFCGTPCEVGGLLQYLNKDYENLITADLICGCVSSPKVYKTYIDFLTTRYKSKVTSVNFKDKRMGWRGKAIAVRFENGEEYYNSILDDDYCVSFHSRYNIRPSCFNCKYRSLKRVADITLGDFWAIERYNPEYDDNKGTSFVLANSQRGHKAIEDIEDADVHKMDIDLEEYCNKYNWCMHKNPYGMNEDDRRTFYHDTFSMPFDAMAKKDLEEIKIERKKRKSNCK